MTYRFLKLTSVYPVFAEAFETQANGSECSFDGLNARFIGTRYGLSDYFSRHLRALGNEAEERFVTVERLQKLWAQERSFPFTEESWLQQIVIEQVKEFKPDVLFYQDLYLFDRNFRDQIKHATNALSTTLGWRTAPTRNFSGFEDLDLVLTSSPAFAHAFKESGAQSAVLPFGFDPILLEETNEQSDRIPFSFLGTVGISTGDHSSRYRLIRELLLTTPLEVFSSTEGGLSVNPLKRRVLSFLYRLNRRLAPAGLQHELLTHLPGIRSVKDWETDRALPELHQMYKERWHPPRFGLDYFQTLRNSLVSLNAHLDATGDYAVNMRLFEATGMGSCLLTDSKSNIEDYFEPDSEIVVFRSVQECRSKALSLLNDPRECSRIAKAGQARVLRDHSMEQRVLLLDALIKSILEQK